MKRASANKAAGCLMALFFAHALILGGISMTRGIPAAGTGKACLVSFDVCGHGAPASATGNFELQPFLFTSISFHIPAFPVYPPTPDKAVATAEAGDTEKPPEA